MIVTWIRGERVHVEHLSAFWLPPHASPPDPDEDDDCCMCGSMVRGHSYTDNHGPVGMHAYARGQDRALLRVEWSPVAVGADHGSLLDLSDHF